jgi:hypothetical protein
MTRSPTSPLLRGVLAAGLLALVGTAQGETPPIESWQGPSVHFFAGPKRCSLAGLGSRGDFESNRVVLDDARTRATWSAHGRKLVIDNRVEYDDETLIACVLVLGTGTTDSGEEVPVGAHLYVYKEDDEFTTTVHAHVTTREGIKQADFITIQVVLTDGKQREVVFTKTKGLQALRDPFTESTLAKVIGLEGVDNLEGEQVDITKPGSFLADGTVSLGHGFVSTDVMRAQLVALDGAKPLEPGAPLSSVFAQGSFELRLHCLSSLFPNEKFVRDLFLLGLADLPILRRARKDGLEDGDTLTFRFSQGAGTVTFAGKSARVANAADVVRHYLECDFVGGIIAYQLQQRLQPKAGGAK